MVIEELDSLLPMASTSSLVNDGAARHVVHLFDGFPVKRAVHTGDDCMRVLGPERCVINLASDEFTGF